MAKTNLSNAVKVLDRYGIKYDRWPREGNIQSISIDAKTGTFGELRLSWDFGNGFILVPPVRAISLDKANLVKADEFLTSLKTCVKILHELKDA